MIDVGDVREHPTGHVATLEPGEEYGPRVGVICRCECGAVVELRIGNYKGNLGMDAVLLGAEPEKKAPEVLDPWNVTDPRNAAFRL